MFINADGHTNVKVIVNITKSCRCNQCIYPHWSGHWLVCVHCMSLGNVNVINYIVTPHMYMCIVVWIPLYWPLSIFLEILTIQTDLIQLRYYTNSCPSGTHHDIKVTFSRDPSVSVVTYCGMCSLEYCISSNCRKGWLYWYDVKQK